MGDILIENMLSQETTWVSNQFIDGYMPQANGEFVKVYLFLLRMTQGAQVLSLSAMADHLDCTERDVLRGLRYWEKTGLMRLTFQSRKLTGIAFLPFTPLPPAVEEVPPTEAATTVDRKEDLPSSSDSQVPQPAVTLPAKGTLTADEKKVLKEKDEVSQLFFIAEQYLGRTLSKTDMDNLLYYYSGLHFSADLIEYLVEYCVSKGSRSARYIETVALAWAKDGITTVQQAKENTTLHNKNYFSILKAMGIKSRNPVKLEQDFMSSWLDKLCFSMDLILEACQRTVIQTGQASFPYADTILKEWHSKGVKHLSDLTSLDAKHKQLAARTSKERTTSKSSQKSEYPHRNYDYEEIQKSLFKQ